MHIKDCPDSGVYGFCNKNLGIEKEESDGTYIINLTNCCFCELKVALGHFPIIGGFLTFKSKYYPDQIEILDGSNLNFIKHQSDVVDLEKPTSLETTLIIDIDQINYEVQLKFEQKLLMYAEFKSTSKLASNLILELLYELQNKDDFDPLLLTTPVKKVSESYLVGSPSVIQFKNSASNKDIEDYIISLESAIINVDTESIWQLESDALIKDVGIEPFHKEVIDELDKAIAGGRNKFKVSDGYCRSCLLNKPVKMFTAGIVNFGLHYHIEPGSPVEIHGCSYCGSNKSDSLEEGFDKLMSGKDRPPELVETTIRIGKAMLDNNVDDLYELCGQMTSYGVPGDSIEDTHIFILFTERLDRLNKIEPIKNVRLAFLAYNEEDWMTNPKDYDGQPCLFYELAGVEFILIWDGELNKASSITELLYHNDLDITVSSIKIE